MNSSTAKQIDSQGQNRILTFAEACRYLSVAKPTLYKWVAEGKVPAFKVAASRVWKFDIHDLNKWIDAQKVAGSNR